MTNAKKSGQTMAVATIGETVPDALKAIKEELSKLQAISETSYKTGSDGKVENFPNSIQTETSIDVLVKMHSSAFGRNKAYNDSQAHLSELIGGNFAAPLFKINGATFDAIESDIVLRINVLSVKERKEKLETLLKEAQEFMTREDKFSMFQQKLAAFVGGSAE
jgi:hypothetical protein